MEINKMMDCFKFILENGKNFYIVDMMKVLEFNDEEEETTTEYEEQTIIAFSAINNKCSIKTCGEARQQNTDFCYYHNKKFNGLLK